MRLAPRAFALGFVSTMTAACALVAGIDDHFLAAGPDAAGGPSGPDGINGNSNGNGNGGSLDGGGGDGAGVRTEGGGGGPISYIQMKEAAAANAFGVYCTPFDQEVADHDLILVSISVDATGVASVAAPTLSDGKNVYNRVMEVADGAARAYIYAATVADNQIGGVEVQFSATMRSIEVEAMTYRGVTVPDSDHDGQIAPCPANGTDCAATRRLHTTAPSLLFAFAAATMGVWTGSGFTRRDTFHSDIVVEDRFVGPGDYPATATSASAGNVLIIAAMFPAE